MGLDPNAPRAVHRAVIERDTTFRDARAATTANILDPAGVNLASALTQPVLAVSMRCGNERTRSRTCVWVVVAPEDARRRVKRRARASRVKRLSDRPFPKRVRIVRYFRSSYDPGTIPTLSPSSTGTPSGSPRSCASRSRRHPRSPSCARTARTAYIAGHSCPPVWPRLVPPVAGVDHGLDGEHVPLLHGSDSLVLGVVGDVRRAVEQRADAVAVEALDHGALTLRRDLGDLLAYVPVPSPRASPSRCPAAGTCTPPCTGA